MYNIITAKSLNFFFPGEKQASLNNTSFKINKGELICLGGINGSGKSTLLNILAGLYPPSNGELYIFDNNIKKATKKELVKVRLQVSLLVQDADSQIIGSTVEEDLNLSFPLSTRKDSDEYKKNQQEAKEIAQKLSLLHKWESPCQSLSYGQRRKLCLGAALLRKPKLLLLDEPFSGLDYPGIKEFIKILHSLKNKGVSIIISSHDFSLLRDLANSYIFLSLQYPCLWGSAQELFPSAEKYGLRIP